MWQKKPEGIYRGQKTFFLFKFTSLLQYGEQKAANKCAKFPLLLVPVLIVHKGRSTETPSVVWIPGINISVSLHSKQVHTSTFCVSEICHCFERLNIWFASVLWMSPCGYTLLFFFFCFFFVIVEKTYEFLKERCKEAYNHKLCIHQYVSVLWASLWARWLRQRDIHGAVFATRTFGSRLSHFL